MDFECIASAVTLAGTLPHMVHLYRLSSPSGTLSIEGRKMKDSATSIEFFTPNLGLELEPYLAREIKQGIHHLGRYHWACHVLGSQKPKRVLDVACGSGYGSYMLATTLPEATVIGADYDQRAIDLARASYAANNLRYVMADVTQWASDQDTLGAFDVVVSFDTIEHLLHREIALLRICENLSDDGCLLLSTPCGRIVTQLNPAWEHHKIEYSGTDLYKFLRRFFKQVVPPDDGLFPDAGFWANLNRDKLRYLNRMNPLFCRNPIRF
jgi:SAM-dependent methyltransferase